MRVRRTGGGKGRKAIWYVWADRPEEQEAVRAGLLEERAPDGRWRYVLAWGFASRSAAREAMKGLEEEVAGVLTLSTDYGNGLNGLDGNGLLSTDLGSGLNGSAVLEDGLGERGQGEDEASHSEYGI